MKETRQVVDVERYIFANKKEYLSLLWFVCKL